MRGSRRSGGEPCCLILQTYIYPPTTNIICTDGTWHNRPAAICMTTIRHGTRCRQFCSQTFGYQSIKRGGNYSLATRPARPRNNCVKHGAGVVNIGAAKSVWGSTGKNAWTKKDLHYVGLLWLTWPRWWPHWAFHFFSMHYMYETLLVYLVA